MVSNTLDTHGDERHARRPPATDPARLIDAIAHPFALADRQGRIVVLNPAAQSTLGWERGARLAERLASARTDNDLPRLLRGEGPLLGRTLEVEAHHADGRLVPIQLTVTELQDDSRLLGVSMIDMTQRDDARIEQAAAEARAADAFAASTVGVAIVGLDGTFLEVNPALCALLDRDEPTLLACSFQALTHPDDLESDLGQLRRTLAGELDRYQLPKRYLRPDGGIVWALLTVTIVRGRDRKPRHFVSQIQDITDRKTSEDELRRYTAQLAALADTDPLTGLANRHVFEEAVERALQATDGVPCCLAGVHLAGGAHALLSDAQVVADAVDGHGVLAHLGGGEIAILLCHEDARDPDVLTALVDTALATPGACTTVVPEPGDTAALLLERLRSRQCQAPDVHPAIADQDVPSGIARLLELARRQLGMPVSFLTRHADGNSVFARIVGDHEHFGVTEGDRLPLADTHCQRMLDGRIALSVPDLLEDRETRDLYVTTGPGLRAYAGVPVRLRSGELYGTLCAVDTRPHPELDAGREQLLRFIGDLAAELIDQFEEDRTRREVELSATGVRALLAALEARDFYTSEHSREVVALAIAVARRLGVEERAVRDIEQVALLHDIGKLGIPDAILQKQGPLDEQQWEIMRQHPVIGERIIAGTAGLTHLAPAMRAEHERYDGGGYPDGLAGEAIPLASRITLACDALHAMTSDRPYRPAMTTERAHDELRANAGSQFDPAVVTALLAELSGCR